MFIYKPKTQDDEEENNSESRTKMMKKLIQIQILNPIL